MKKKLLSILILMTLCVSGIIGLQLFWNYQNYTITVKTFDNDINEALRQAVYKESNQRQQQIIRKFKGWLADTSLITITADHKNRDSSTVFYIQDAHPKFSEDKTRKIQFGLSEFKDKLNHITPYSKAILINHFGDKIVKEDISEGIVYHYTQTLGDSLGRAFIRSKINLSSLNKLFHHELALESINSKFVFNPKNSPHLYLTKSINTSLRKPFKVDPVFAGFESPNTYFFKNMKWIIISSLVLIIITIGCYTYTLSALMSQNKLAELKDAFVNNITHELNTPIASIKITTEALKSYKHNLVKEAEYLDIISYQAERLNSLTSQILDNEKLTIKKVNNFCNVDLNQIMIEVIENLQPQVKFCNGAISYRDSKRTVNVYGDKSDLRNVLINLFENALKYNSNRPKVIAELTTTDNEAMISISDNGIGIPKEFHSAVFERFFRVPQGDLHNIKGFGLGLNYVKQVIQQHRGKISLSDNFPTGTKFTIKLSLR